MTPDEEREIERFEAALRGDGEPGGAAHRLGETLRRRQAEALARRDEATQMRVWKAIDAGVNAETRRASPGFMQRMRYAQAAAVLAFGIAAGWLMKPAGVTDIPPRLEFAYGEMERPRGGLVERTLHDAHPADSLRGLTDLLIADRIPFEVYSLGAGPGRRVLFTLPPEVPAATAAHLRTLGLEPASGAALSLTFAGPP